jgi:tRNA(Ile2) C34 agmatinyltransferase TiaS
MTRQRRYRDEIVVDRHRRRATCNRCGRRLHASGSQFVCGPCWREYGRDYTFSGRPRSPKAAPMRGEA